LLVVAQLLLLLRDFPFLWRWLRMIRCSQKKDGVKMGLRFTKKIKEEDQWLKKGKKRVNNKASAMVWGPLVLLFRVIVVVVVDVVAADAGMGGCAAASTAVAKAAGLLSESGAGSFF
jgi:hypothetical protein